MSLWSRIHSSLAAILRRSEMESEMDAELHFHMEAFAEDLMRNGVPREEAMRRARIEFGGVERFKEECREARGFKFVEDLLSDLRFGLRWLRKSPGFTTLAVLTLALGIGANAAVFSIVNAVMLRPLPYTDSQRLLIVNSKVGMFPDMELNLNWPAFEKIREQASSFEQSAVYRQKSMALTGKGDPELLETAGVSDKFFEMFGAHPILGRLLGDADRDEKNGKVAVLNQALWRTRFAASPKVIGEKITLDGEPYTIVGVAGKRFAFPQSIQLWTSLDVAPDTKVNPTFFAFTFVGKVKKDANYKHLNAELNQVSTQMLKEFPRLKDGYQLAAMPLLRNEIGDARLGLYVLLGAATLVLLIACTNLASMLLARGWARRQEMAIRAALGASHGRLLRQILVESCLLAILGGGTGIAFALLGVRLFRVIAPPDTPRLAEIHPDWAVVAFALCSALITGIFFGLAPARHALRAAVHETLKQGTGSKSVGGPASQSKAGAILVAAEVALSFVLLIGAGLMLQTLNRLLHQSPGFRTDNLLTFDLYSPGLRSEADRKKNSAIQTAQTKDIIQQVQQLPGVADVAAANYGLLDGNVLVHGGLKVEGSNTIDPGAGFAVRGRYVSPTYFSTLGLPLLRGRRFTEVDDMNSPSVAIVNEQMARKFWGTLDVPGKRFSSSRDAKGNETWSEIVGVVTGAREFLVRDEPVAEYYLALYQGGITGSSLLVRGIVKPDVLFNTVTRQIWHTYPNLPITHSTTIQTVIEQSVGNERLHAALLAVFGGIGLLMALAGTYGVIAYAVERRTQEIGIRIALGASRKDVLVLVCRHAFIPVLAGITVGIPAALLVQRAIASELFGVKPTDLATFAVAALLMTVAAALACWLPARRASRVDPMVALRYE